MDERLNTLLKEIKKRFKDAKIYLFGSRAKGKAGANADFDLIIVSKKFEETLFVNRAGDIWRNSETGFAADLLCYTPKEFANASKTSVVLRDALKYAVPL